ncbi:hypothetical protein BDV96DRAFT_596031 [Lophiotrema nucula]|uniref:Uncharacterized protein n=1 Tax=Lophiotrema nucula TaxID=690887 RepID=A0A6A5ZK98_9PLEO|nr:hypothetical protein BDV96DRAFT_596031 [Lophiotrema nucula]
MDGPNTYPKTGAFGWDNSFPVLHGQANNQAAQQPAHRPANHPHPSMNPQAQDFFPGGPSESLSLPAELQAPPPQPPRPLGEAFWPTTNSLSWHASPQDGPNHQLQTLENPLGYKQPPTLQHGDKAPGIIKPPAPQPHQMARSDYVETLTQKARVEPLEAQQQPLIPGLGFNSYAGAPTPQTSRRMSEPGPVVQGHQRSGSGTNINPVLQSGITPGAGAGGGQKQAKTSTKTGSWPYLTEETLFGLKKIKKTMVASEKRDGTATEHKKKPSAYIPPGLIPNQVLRNDELSPGNDRLEDIAKGLDNLIVQEMEASQNEPSLAWTPPNGCTNCATLSQASRQHEAEVESLQQQLQNQEDQSNLIFSLKHHLDEKTRRVTEVQIEHQHDVFLKNQADEKLKTMQKAAQEYVQQQKLIKQKYDNVIEELVDGVKKTGVRKKIEWAEKLVADFRENLQAIENAAHHDAGEEKAEVLAEKANMQPKAPPAGVATVASRNDVDLDPAVLFAKQKK